MILICIAIPARYDTHKTVHDAGVDKVCFWRQIMTKKNIVFDMIYLLTARCIAPGTLTRRVVQYQCPLQKKKANINVLYISKWILFMKFLYLGLLSCDADIMDWVSCMPHYFVCVCVNSCLFIHLHYLAVIMFLCKTNTATCKQNCDTGCPITRVNNTVFNV